MDEPELDEDGFTNDDYLVGNLAAIAELYNP